MEEECSLRSSPPCCINIEGCHLPTSHECSVVIKHKMVLSLASTKNILITDARKKINISNFPFSFNDPRLNQIDYAIIRSFSLRIRLVFLSIFNKMFDQGLFSRVEHRTSLVVFVQNHTSVLLPYSPTFSKFLRK